MGNIDDEKTGKVQHQHRTKLMPFSLEQQNKYAGRLSEVSPGWLAEREGIECISQK